mgnify:CR=1 FL=1
MYYAISFVIAYFLGAVSFSYIFTKLIKKDDIRKYGSGNAGATNTMRVLGVRYAILVLLLDVLKGMAAMGIAMALHLSNWGVALTGLIAIIGHVWPVYYGFRGGKGVATTIGFLCLLMFKPALIAGVIAIALIAITRYVSLGSLVFVIFTPVFALAFFPEIPGASIAIAFCAAALSFWKHRANIQRLLKGEENKIGSKTKDI